MSLYRGGLYAGLSASYEVQFGISNTISAVIMQNEDLTKTDVAHVIHDQYGRVANEMSYDEDKRGSFTFIASAMPSGPAAVGGTFVYAGITWKIDSINENGTFDGLKRWSVSAHCYYNYPGTVHDWTAADLPATE